MTVAEMIAALQSYPPDMRVLVDGYEAGYANPKPLTVLPEVLTFTDEDAGMYGNHCVPGDFLDDVDESVPPFAAVVIPR